MRNFIFILSSTLLSTTALSASLLAQPQLSPQQQQQIRNLNLPSNILNSPFNSKLNTPFENRFPEPLKPQDKPIIEWKTDHEASKCTTPGGYKGHWISYDKDGKKIVECFNQDEQWKLILQNAQKNKVQSGVQEHQ